MLQVKKRYGRNYLNNLIYLSNYNFVGCCVSMSAVFSWFSPAEQKYAYTHIHPIEIKNWLYDTAISAWIGSNMPVNSNTC